APDVAHVPGRLNDVARARLALRPDHRRALGDPAQRLAQVRRAAYERHRERPLVDVVRLVRWGKNLRLIDVIHPDGLQHLRFDEMADPAFGHYRDRYGRDDAVDHVGVAHPRDTALDPDVGWHAFQRHHRDGAGVFGDLRVLGGDHVHDHAALEHVRHAPLDPLGAGHRYGRRLRGAVPGAGPSVRSGVGGVGGAMDRHGSSLRRSRALIPPW